MDVRVRPGVVSGNARAPPSKSYTHRAFLAAGLSDTARITDPLMSADTRATIRAVEAFGGAVDITDNTVSVDGFSGQPGPPDDVIDCANSGTTMRLTIGTAALVDGHTVLTGDDSLRERPQGPLLTAIETLGGNAISTRSNGQAPVVISGPIAGGPVEIPGDVSSQYISALLMAGACMTDGIDITLSTQLKSAPYVDITIEVMEAFGVQAERTASGFRTNGNQEYRRAEDYPVPGDFSSISYLLGAGAIASESGLTVRGAYPSAQGDTAIVEIIERMGADLSWEKDAGTLHVAKSSLSGVEVGVADTPDLLPTIAALGAIADGTTRITDCEHVRYKETDRVSAMATELTRFGAVVEEEQETLTVHGGESELIGTRVKGYADHRIIMALALVGLVANGETTISGAEHVDVSFPAFFDVMSDLGATITRE